MLSVNEVAEAFNVSRMTVYRWIKDGKLKDLTLKSVLDYNISKNAPKIRLAFWNKLLKEDRIRKRCNHYKPRKRKYRPPKEDVRVRK